jgi:two-component system, sensor histidine kinase and response regulator
MNSDSPPKGSILVVDDSPDNLRALSITLAEDGYKSRCVTTGEMALISINNLLPDLILLDIRMPIMNGYDVCQQLKANPKTKDIPIIFLSAADDLAGKIKAFAIGGVDYITKPFQAKDVLVRIANQLTIQRLRNQLMEKNQRLHKEIDEHKHTSAALQDAKEAAEAASDAKGKFLATMSHELRTPLNAILGFTELMRSNSSLPKESQDYLTSISQSGQHLLKLLNHILAVNSAESSKISLNEHDFDLHRLFGAIASTCHQKAHAKGFQFVLECAPTVPQYVHADESKLRQILMNLLENMIQPIQDGKVMLRVNAESYNVDKSTYRRGWEGQEKGNGDEKDFHLPIPFFSHPPIPLIFEIEDMGSKIAVPGREQLFQRDSPSRVEQPSEQGSGLGLLINRQFVQVMGGDITIASTSTQGTMVRFYILVHPVESASELRQSSLQTGDGATAASILPPTHPPFYFTAERMLETMRAEMSADWLAQLHQAALKGFDYKIFQLIQEIPPTHSSLVKALMDWNQNFQFDQILSVTQHVLEQTS